VKTMTVWGGTPISQACAEAVKIATETGETVDFEFNGTPVAAQPGEDDSSVFRRFWMTRRLRGHGI
jgi:hypothetical protein